ncbi:hypothetical protein HZB03_04660 [Candidatus Woesearchaeota archaeon]|nr:hypothetical protein [Candidatus Woesearchaeota archaeon]
MTCTDRLYADRILPYNPWRIIDIHNDRALEEIIRRSRIEDEVRKRQRAPRQVPHYDVPFIHPQERSPDPPQPRIYIDE